MGPASVGKSAISLRYTRKVFIDDYLPSIEDIYKKVTNIDTQTADFDILDTSGLTIELRKLI